MKVPVVQAAALCALSSRDFVLVSGLASARAGGAVTVRECRATSGGPVRGQAEPAPGSLPVPWGPA